MFEIPAALLALLYSLASNYVLAIALMALVIVAITTPLTWRHTKAVLAMQNLAPEMRRLQREYASDRQRLNEEMMRLYQSYKVNPLSSCWPAAVQAAVFYVVFRLLRGLVYRPHGAAEPVAQRVWSAFGESEQAADPGIIPRYVSLDSELYRALFGEREMVSLGLDLSRSAIASILDGAGSSVVYLALVLLLGVLYVVLQRVSSSAAGAATSSPTQQLALRYVPVVLAVFQLFFLAALVVYYIVQTGARIGQRLYIRRRLEPPQIE